MFNWLSSLIFPPRCPICGELTGSDEPCETCEIELKKHLITGAVCNSCGQYKSKCDCGKVNFFFSGICGVYENSGVAREAVYAIKYHNCAFAAEYFGCMLADCFKMRFPNVNPDIVCAVPMFKHSERDYNHAELLAHHAAKRLDKPFLKRVLVKVRENEPQHKLSSQKRRENVKNAYVAKGDLSGKIVLLIDDIKTTAATLNECAKQLRLAGAEDVYCAVALISVKDTCNDNQTEI